jgi:polar amino acid transport system substrate-binding protein
MTAIFRLRREGQSRTGIPGGTMRTLSKIVLTTALAAIAATTGASAKEWKSAKIASEGAFPPFNFMDANKQLQGFDIDITKAVCEKAKIKCDFVVQDWDGMIPALLAKKYDAIAASMSITEERKKKVDFSDKYYNSPARFVTTKTNGFTDTTPEGLKGKTIGAQSSTVQANFLEDVYKPKGVNIKLYATQDEAGADMLAGRLDGLMADAPVLYEWLEKAGGNACCQFVGPDYKDVKYFGEGIGFAVRKDKDSADLKAQLNKALAEILKDGTYEKINKKYFPFSIY